MTWPMWFALLLFIGMLGLIFVPNGTLLRLGRKLSEWASTQARRFQRASSDAKPTKSNTEAAKAEKPEVAKWLNRTNSLITLAILAVIIIFVSLALWGYQFPRTGFAAKSLWDWLDLLIVPLAIAVSASLYSWMERRNERRLVEQRIKEDRRIADERTQDTAIEAYLLQMSSLLVDKHLLDPQEGAPARNIARTWTLTLLQRLSSERKGLVIQFLFESRLIEIDDTAVSLVDSNLQSSNLYEAKLQGVNLEGANLCEAELSGADLSEANFHGSNLAKANLTQANLYAANLSSVNFDRTILQQANLGKADLEDSILHTADLQWANLFRVNLHEHYLYGINLHGANLEKAILTETNLYEANLSDTILSGANLRGADLHGANLYGANLEDANLEWSHLYKADLRGQYLEKARLKSARYSRSTIWPDGFDVASSGAILVEDDDIP